MSPTTIRSAQSKASDARQAVRDFHAGVAQTDMAFVIFFCSSRYDLAALADEINRLFPGIEVIGCTTAGEIGPCGYCDSSISGASFSGRYFSGVTGLLGNLKDFNPTRCESLVMRLQHQLDQKSTESDGVARFAFCLIDGLSVREEQVAQTVQSALEEIPVVGGSAGDDLDFVKTWVFHGSHFHTDCAVLLLASTPIPFQVYKSEHFSSGGEALIVTEADPALRQVKTLNGLPAAEEYARVTGVTVGQLNTWHFAGAPVAVFIGGTQYVRSIQKVNADGSLTFYCAIEEGHVLRVAHSTNLLFHLAEALERLKTQLGTLEAVLTCDCILRKLEISQKSVEGIVGDIFTFYNAVGFNTYGEQFGGVHVNQTLTGIAFGAPPLD